MRVLVDTNIVARISAKNHPQSETALLSVQTLLAAGHAFRTVPQVFYEFWAVVTRPVSQNGLGLEVDQVEAELTLAQRMFPVLRDERTILKRWRLLVTQHMVIGKKAHDARLVAAMQRHGLTHILTFNGADFARYPRIAVLDPHEVVQS